jgi:hypothetical protein
VAVCRQTGSRGGSGEPGDGQMLKNFDVKNFDEVQKLSKDNLDVAMKSFGVMSKGFQAIAVEVADYSKKSFEEGSATFEKLIGAKSLEKAIEIQTEYAKSAYEGFIAGATRIGELYADLAKETYKPFETVVAKASGK